MGVSFSNLIILIILAIAIIGSNKTVALAAAIVLIINLLKLEQRFFPFFEAKGIEIGVVFIMLAILVPLASGEIDKVQVMATLTNLRTVLAIAIGILVAFLGGKGVDLMSDEPQLVTGIIFGTVIGAAFLKGVPVGPLICSGMLYYLFKLFRI